MRKGVLLCSSLIILLLSGCVKNTYAESAYHHSAKTINDAQEKLLHETIINQNMYETDKELAYIEHHEILQVDETNTELIVYATVFCASYTRDLKADSGINFPVRITYEKKDGEYTLKEYWLPSDGSLYVPSIQEAFPKHLVDAALKPDDYDKIKEAMYRKEAKAYFEAEGTL